jgi:hypothetical protein
MRTPRAIAATALALLLTLALAAPALAAGKVPQGKGLTTLAAEGITAITCTDPTIHAGNVILPPGGGGATWVTDGRLYVVRSFNFTGTMTTPEGTFPVDFEVTFGKKKGLADESVTCTFHVTFEEDGATFHLVGTVVLYRVW